MNSKFILSALSLLLAAYGSVAQPYKVRTTENTVRVTADHFNPMTDYGLGKLVGGVVFVRNNNTNDYALYAADGRCIASGLDVRAQYRNEFLPAFYDDVATVHPDRHPIGIIDKQGKIVKTIPNATTISTRFVDGMATVITSVATSRSGLQHRRTFQYVDTRGNAIHPQLRQTIDEYADLVEPRPFRDGLSCYWDYAKRRYGYFDKTGRIVIPARFTQAHDFSEGLAAVTEEDTREPSWGFIDTSGNYVIAPKFHNEPDDFHDGYAVVTKQNDKMTYIDKQGTPCSFEVDRAKRFFHGYAFVDNPGASGFLVIDTAMKVVRQVERAIGYSKCTYNEGNQTVMINRDRLFAPDGTLLLDVYGSIDPFAGEYAYFNSNQQGIPSGFIDKKGELVMIFVKSEF